MDLCQEMIESLFMAWLAEQSYETLPNGVQLALGQKAYGALCEIQRILEDDSLTDEDCFWKIEKIVCVFEVLGSSAGKRHDFG